MSPRIVRTLFVVVGGVLAGGCTGCSFEADYSAGGFACTDGRCPSGLTCVNETCVDPATLDGGNDGPGDGADATDGPMAALTCADPGIVGSTGGMVSGTTTNHPMNLSGTCGGFVMNGREAVYRIDLVAGDSLLVSISNSARKAYVIASCVTPAPACLGNTLATEGNPISVMPAAGPSFVVVDDENPSLDGPYTLTLTVN